MTRPGAHLGQCAADQPVQGRVVQGVETLPGRVGGHLKYPREGIRGRRGRDRGEIAVQPAQKPAKLPRLPRPRRDAAASGQPREQGIAATVINNHQAPRIRRNRDRDRPAALPKLPQYGVFVADRGLGAERAVAAEHQACAGVPVLVVATRVNPVRPNVLQAIRSQDQAQCHRRAP